MRRIHVSNIPRAIRKHSLREDAPGATPEGGTTQCRVPTATPATITLSATGNDGTYTDPINRTGGSSYNYQVCESGTTTCSNEAAVVF